MKTNVYVAIPVYNEGASIYDLCLDIKKELTLSRVVIVDDGSSKRFKLPSRKIKVLRHIINLGKGAAMKTAAQYCFEKKASHVIFMDGDGQHMPSDLPKFLKKINRGYDVVLGVRRGVKNQPVIRGIGNKFAALYIKILFGKDFTDLLSGFRALSRNAYIKTEWDSRKYGVETEMAAKMGLYGKMLKVSEVLIKSNYADKYKGVTILDALNILFETIWWKLTWAYK